MWKLVSILLLACLSTSSAQTVDLECLFGFSFVTYSCQLFGIEAVDPNVQYNFVGEHIGNRTNDDVELVEIIESNTPFVIPEIFKTFPNMVELDIRNSSLRTVELPADHQLERIYLVYNNIENIGDGAFGNQTNLIVISLNRNNIASIEENAFAGHPRLERIFLIGNRLTELTGRVFANVPTLQHLDLENNNLTRIEAETFAENHELVRLYLEYNEITAISPLFIRNLTNINYINLNGNECVRSSFYLDDEFDSIFFHQSLFECYNEFSPRAPTDDQIMSMEFTGRLNVYDGFGNIIAVINQGFGDEVPETTTPVGNETETTTVAGGF